ncbi:DUF2059 domain-containing protein [Flavobacterium sp. Sd200]|uniref:DUF2059 domain-containing protein n=1 Tax=Flavobacterium sp. Sd200 TaxID=2692211 RepID=UPI00137007BA|nr:DUF2059 domain-containing protein [Flavobacterium sp. Sd200]MXN92897.1 DUF2059 domain-containing protein [Flavobacterium sp. Sd200]
MKRLLLAVAFMFATQFAMSQTAAKPADPALKKEVIRLLDLSGANAQYEVAIDQIVKSVAADKQAAFKKEIMESLKGLNDKIADIYLQEFTAEDIKAMIKYYESPIGKKQASKAGVLAEKGQAAGMEWGQSLQGVMMKYME